MEFELGLKLTKVADEFGSAGLLIAKDRAGPLFLSTETDNMFILTGYLKGYKIENIKIDINEEGNRIAIGGERLVQQTVMLGWTMVKKEREMTGFRKAFKIPDGVLLDGIKARFNDDDSVLKVSMPKLAKGLTGVKIEEVKDDGNSRAKSKLPVVADDLVEKGVEQIDQKVENSVKRKEVHDTREEENKVLENHHNGNNGIEYVGSRESEPCETTIQQRGVPSCNQAETSHVHETKDQDDANKNQSGQENKICGIGTEEINGNDDSLGETQDKSYSDRSTQTDKPPPKSSKICAPMIAGSALIVSLIVFVFHFITEKNKQAKGKY